MQVYIIFATISLALIAYIAALLGIFVAPLIAFVWIIVQAVVFLRFRMPWSCDVPQRSLITLYAFALVAAVFVATTTTPTIWSGRDQGAIAEAAWHLSQERTLLWSTPGTETFSALYGRGEALNVPGFTYTADGQVLSKFPAPYTAWVAFFVQLFGLAGYALANAVLVFVAWSTMLLLLLQYTQRLRMTVLYYALLLCSFPMLFFARMTLSENLALVVFWSVAYLGALLLRASHIKPLLYITTLVALFFAPLVRIEGWTLLLMAVALLLWQNTVLRSWILQRPFVRATLPCALFGTLFIVAFVVTTPYFAAMAKVFIKTASETSLAPDVAVDAQALSTPVALAQLYLLYGMLLPLGATILYVFCIVRARVRGGTCADKDTLLPLLFFATVFVYYITPQITLDHPWMLRRYYFVLIPVTLFYTVLLTHRLWSRGHQIAGTVLITATYALLLPTTALLTVTEHRGLTNYAADLAQHFRADDLVLIDRGATGDPFAMLPGILRTQHDIDAIYFFNPDDFAKIETDPYGRIFLIAPEDETRYTMITPKDPAQRLRLAPLRTTSFGAHQLHTTSQHVPRATTHTVDNMLYQLY